MRLWLVLSLAVTVMLFKKTGEIAATIDGNQLLRVSGLALNLTAYVIGNAGVLYSSTILMRARGKKGLPSAVNTSLMLAQLACLAFAILVIEHPERFLTTMILLSSIDLGWLGHNSREMNAFIEAELDKRPKTKRHRKLGVVRSTRDAMQNWMDLNAIFLAATFILYTLAPKMLAVAPIIRAAADFSLNRTYYADSWERIKADVAGLIPPAGA